MCSLRQIASLALIVITFSFSPSKSLSLSIKDRKYLDHICILEEKER